MSYLRYLCLFAYCGVQHMLCYVFVLLFFVLCDMCYQKDIDIYWQIGQKSQYLLGLKIHDFGRFVTNWSVENMTPNLTPHMLSLDVSSSLC
jgi:hypothetical protein